MLLNLLFCLFVYRLSWFFTVPTNRCCSALYMLDVAGFPSSGCIDSLGGKGVLIDSAITHHFVFARHHLFTKEAYDPVLLCGAFRSTSSNEYNNLTDS